MIFLSRKITYVPKCRGNRDLPENEQIKFDAHAMTGEEEERLTTIVYRTTIDGESVLKVDAKVIDTFISQVDKVYNAFDENKKPILTSAEFVKLPGSYEYVTEMVAFIKSGLKDEEIKN